MDVGGQDYGDEEFRCVAIAIDEYSCDDSPSVHGVQICFEQAPGAVKALVAAVGGAKAAPL